MQIYRKKISDKYVSLLSTDGISIIYMLNKTGKTDNRGITGNFIFIRFTILKCFWCHTKYLPIMYQDGKYF